MFKGRAFLSHTYTEKRKYPNIGIFHPTPEFRAGSQIWVYGIVPKFEYLYRTLKVGKFYLKMGLKNTLKYVCLNNRRTFHWVIFTQIYVHAQQLKSWVKFT